ncbi:MAG: hypothetical protein ACYDHH_10365 [Solirubrobacteraceae bacterium]
MTHRFRRLLARLLIVCTLVVVPMGAVGCGAGGHLVGGIVAHHVANHLFPGHRRLISKAFCIYHVHRAIHDLTHHHPIFGALNVYEAIKNCRAGFSQSGRHP